MSRKEIPVPSEIRLLKASRCLEISYQDGTSYSLPFEFLRVYSPSAEVRGHGPGEEVLQTGKKDVDIEEIEPVGSYALKIRFSDGHDSGLYSWDLLYDFCLHFDPLWREYLDRIEQAGASREP